MRHRTAGLAITLETVTPLFLGGVNQRGEPELRPPSFRGALRYWLRAALGGVIGDRDIATLFELESAVFGSTERGSPVSVRLRVPGGDLNRRVTKILPHKEGREAGRRSAFDPSQQLELTMSQVRAEDEAVWKSACSALVLALTFGGVGLRSRRGHGTLRINATNNTSLAPVFPDSLCGWETHTKQAAESAIDCVRALCKSRGKHVLGTPPAGPTRYPCANASGLLRLCDLGATSAMDAVTQFMRSVRKSRALGGIDPRQASPLWLRPIRTEGTYGLLFCVLASEFRGQDYGLVRSFLDQHFKGKDVVVKRWNA